MRLVECGLIWWYSEVHFVKLVQLADNPLVWSQIIIVFALFLSLVFLFIYFIFLLIYYVLGLPNYSDKFWFLLCRSMWFHGFACLMGLEKLHPFFFIWFLVFVSILGNCCTNLKIHLIVCSLVIWMLVGTVDCAWSLVFTKNRK